MKKLTPSLALAACVGCLILTSGCATQNAPLTVAIVRSTVSTGAIIGMAEDPSVGPYLRAAAPVICNAAGAGVLDPQAVILALESSDAEQLRTPIGAAIITGGLALYEAVYSYYGDKVQASVVQPYLLGVCQGLQDVVGPPKASKAMRNDVPAHVRFH